ARFNKKTKATNGSDYRQTRGSADWLPRHRGLEKTFGRQQAGSLLGKFFQVEIKRGENLF
ncbi:MAG: hypothetical protein IKW80_05880, partial [Thermoguttaceae bacterium]|nr:hypothetical protein [Thermoguttaceae bacterium]